MNEYIDALKKYAVLRGRATRKQYWMFVLVNVIISIILSLVGFVVSAATQFPYSENILSSIYSLFILIPSIAVLTRRLHDTNRSGWWVFGAYLPGIVLLVLVSVSGLIAIFHNGQSSLDGVFVFVQAAMPLLIAACVAASFIMGIVMLVFSVQDSEPGTNRFGTSTKYPLGLQGSQVESMQSEGGSQELYGPKKNKRSLIIVLIVVFVLIVLVGIFASSILVSLDNTRTRAADSMRVSDINQIRLLIASYRDDNNNSAPPATLSVLTPRYAREIPKDPKTHQSYYYKTNRDNTNYVLGAQLENLSSESLRSDIDGVVYGLNCDDTKHGGPNYCVKGIDFSQL